MYDLKCTYIVRYVQHIMLSTTTIGVLVVVAVVVHCTNYKFKVSIKSI